jgi:hypothetical protein
VAALKVIPPLSITDSNLTSSNVAEADHAAYVAGTTYAIGNRVIVTTPNVHKIYESLQAGNIGHDPLTSPTWWIEVSPTNRWKMFDTSNTTQTTNSNSIVVTITPGRVVNSVALLGLEGTSVTIKVTDLTEGIVYNKTTSLNDNGVINNWYNYFVNSIVRRTDHVATDLPAYGTAAIEITITNTGSTAKCSTCVIGTTQDIGEGINLGASVGIQDYSRKEKNEFGDYVLIHRSWSKRAKFSMAVLNTQIDSLQNALTKLRTTPCVWIGDPNYTSTIIFGYYKDFDIIISNHIVSDCNIDIEGLT